MSTNQKIEKHAVRPCKHICGMNVGDGWGDLVETVRTGVAEKRELDELEREYREVFGDSEDEKCGASKLKDVAGDGARTARWARGRRSCKIRGSHRRRRSRSIT